MTHWYLAPSLARLRSQVDATFPDRSKASDGTIGDAAHAATKSDHNPDPKTGVVRALDLTVDTVQGQRVLAATWQDPRVFYVIWRKQIYYRGESKPRPYNGVNAHMNHVHISIDRNKKSAETDTSNWKGLKMARMISPVQGRVTSEFSRSRKNPVTGRVEPHLGIDIAAPRGTVIRAVYAGTVIGVGAGLLPGRSGDRNVYIQNPDGERQYYGHNDSYLVKNGQWVDAGDPIATVGDRGNATGPHLHFEVHSKSGVARDPRIDFNYHGVTPGSAPDVTAPPKPPKPAPVVPPKSDTARIQTALADMGYDVGPADGKYGNRTALAVEAYQRDLNKYAGAGLFVDGDWGGVLQGWFEWVKQLQRVLPAWRGVPKLRVDGQYGPATANAVKILQRNNGLLPDGKAGAVTTAFMRKHGSNIPNPPKNRP